MPGKQQTLDTSLGWRHFDGFTPATPATLAISIQSAKFKHPARGASATRTGYQYRPQNHRNKNKKSTAARRVFRGVKICRQVLGARGSRRGMGALRRISRQPGSERQRAAPGGSSLKLAQPLFQRQLRPTVGPRALGFVIRSTATQTSTPRPAPPVWVEGCAGAARGCLHPRGRKAPSGPSRA